MSPLFYSNKGTAMLFTVLGMGQYPLYQTIIAAAKALGAGSGQSEDGVSYLRVVSDKSFEKMFGYPIPKESHTAILLATCDGDNWSSSPIYVSIGTAPRQLLCFGSDMKMSNAMEKAFSATTAGNMNFDIDVSSHGKIGGGIVQCARSVEMAAVKGFGEPTRKSSWWNSQPNLLALRRAVPMPSDDSNFVISDGLVCKKVHHILHVNQDILAGGAPIIVIPHYVIHTTKYRYVSYVRAGDILPYDHAELVAYAPLYNGRYRPLDYGSERDPGMSLQALAAYGTAKAEAHTSDATLTAAAKKNIKGLVPRKSSKVGKKKDTALRW